MKIRSGAHLGVIRRWIQWKALNGDQVMWGSDEFVNLKPQTAKDLDRLAQNIADAVYLEEVGRVKDAVQTLLTWTGPNKPPFNPDSEWELRRARMDLEKFLKELEERRSQ